jgi:hypothetical protein
MNIYGYVRTADGSLLDMDGRVIMFSTQRFVAEICEQGCCFVCGARPGSKKFNDEHVVPKWLLRRHQLFNQEISIPNGSLIQYGRYTIPCCAECNSEMGRRIEEPVAELFAGGYDALKEHLRNEGPTLLFRWMALIYIKTHLRDARYRWDADPRKGTGMVGDIYEWDALHHVHCLARSALTGVRLGEGSIGSILVVPALTLPGQGDFDYGDMYFARSFFVRSGEIAIVAVLNDAQAAMIMAEPVLSRITGPLITPQLREVLARFAFANVHLKNRPSFATVPTSSGLTIEADLPEGEFDIDFNARPGVGDFLAHLSEGLFGGDTPEETEEIRQQFRRGERGYLLDATGTFVDYRPRIAAALAGAATGPIRL